MPLRVLSRGSGTASNLVASIDYARRHGAKIINLSLTIINDISSVHDAVRAANAQGILVVAASGNTGANKVQYPAAYPETVAVAATDSSDNRASFSSFGPEVTLAAPGKSIYSTYVGGAYRSLDGTSMATPLVSALAGLVWSMRPDLTHEAVLQLIKDTADDVNGTTSPGSDDFIGAGRINFYAALLAASKEIKVIYAGSPSEQFAVPNQQLKLPFLVRAPAKNSTQLGLPVAGAHVYYQLVPGHIGTAATEGSSLTETLELPKRALSDANGQVSAQFSTPSQPGNYRLRIGVGQSVEELPLTVLPASITLSATTSSVPVSDTLQVPFRLEIKDNSGNAITVPIQIELATTLGRFANGSQRQAVVVTGGIYEGYLRTGTVAGTASLSASIGSLNRQLSITVRPGPPTTIDPRQLLVPVVTSASYNEIGLLFKIYDIYGNHIEDGIAVQLSSSEGEVSPAQTATTQGTVIASIKIPQDVETLVTVVASVPAYDIATSFKVLNIRSSLLMPLMRSSP
jgi:hypothetical protein